MGFRDQEISPLRYARSKSRKTFPRKDGRTAGPSAALLMNNRTLDRPKAFDGLCPAFSAHVRWCEHGAPVGSAVTRTVHCSLNLPQASRLILMNNRALDRPKAFDGLRPSFSAHVRWCEHGAPVECAVARTVHCSLNLTQASRLLGMNNRALDRPKALDGLRPSFSAHVRWCEHGAPIQCAAAGTVHCSLNLPQASRLLGRTRGGWLLSSCSATGMFWLRGCSRLLIGLCCDPRRTAGPSLRMTNLGWLLLSCSATGMFGYAGVRACSLDFVAIPGKLQVSPFG